MTALQGDTTSILHQLFLVLPVLIVLSLAHYFILHAAVLVSLGTQARRHCLGTRRPGNITVYYQSPMVFWHGTAHDPSGVDTISTAESAFHTLFATGSLEIANSRIQIPGAPLDNSGIVIKTCKRTLSKCCCFPSPNGRLKHVKSKRLLRKYCMTQSRQLISCILPSL